MPALIGGPYDGAAQFHGDPQVPSIWVTDICGQIFYRVRPTAGRPQYNRNDTTGDYVFAALDVDTLVIEGLMAA